MTAGNISSGIRKGCDKNLDLPIFVILGLSIAILLWFHVRRSINPAVIDEAPKSSKSVNQIKSNHHFKMTLGSAFLGILFVSFFYLSCLVSISNDSNRWENAPLYFFKVFFHNSCIWDIQYQSLWKKFLHCKSFDFKEFLVTIESSFDH